MRVFNVFTLLAVLLAIAAVLSVGVTRGPGQPWAPLEAGIAVWLALISTGAVLVGAASEE